jgi:hypothetical protein
MIDRSDPDIAKKLLPPKANGVSQGRPSKSSSIVFTPLISPWIALHNGSIVDAAGLSEWETTIPQYECGCRAFYAKYKADNSPDFSTPEAFFAWGVNLHNAVNRKLGKPELTIEEALSIWRNSDGLDMQETESERS